MRAKFFAGSRIFGSLGAEAEAAGAEGAETAEAEGAGVGGTE